MLYTSNSSEETEMLAFSLAKKLNGGECIALSGDLGAGKTAFVRGLARGLGVNGQVSSPTYAIVNEYHTTNNKKDISTLAHFDMYRVIAWADLESCGFFDYMESGAVIAVEWSENIASALPEGTIYVNIVRGKSESERIISVKNARL